MWPYGMLKKENSYGIYQKNRINPKKTMETGVAVKRVCSVCGIVGVALLISCVPRQSKPKALSDIDFAIEYVLFNNDGSLLITKLHDQIEPDFWNTSTGLLASRPDTFLGKFEIVKSNGRIELVVSNNDSKKELYDMLGNHSLGTYPSEAGEGNFPKIISPRKGFLLEWRLGSIDGRRSEWDDIYSALSGWGGGHQFTILLYSLGAGTLVNTFNICQRADILRNGLFIAPATFSDDEAWLAIMRTGWDSKTNPSWTTIYNVNDMRIVKELEAGLLTQDIMISPNKKFLAEYTRDSGWYGIRNLLYEQENKISPPKTTRKLFFINDYSALCVTQRSVCILNCLSGEAEVIADSLLTEDVSLSGNTLAYMNRNNRIRLMDISTFKVIGEFKSKTFGDYRDSSATGKLSRLFWMIITNSGKITCDISFHCALSPGAKYLAVWNFNYAALWDTQKMKLIRFLSK
jgi:hypothetical protein